MSGDHEVLRTTMLEGLVAAAQVNVDAGNDGIRLFELARVYLPSGEPLPEERWRVAGIAEGGWNAARAAVEVLYGALHIPLDVRRPARGELGHLRARRRGLDGADPGADPLRRRHHLPRQSPGHRGRGR
jgi:hypothetical protein